MPAKQGKHKRPRRPVASLDEREGFGVWGERYLEWLAVRNYSPRTVGNVDKALRGFIRFCEARGIVRPAEVTKPILERYQQHLFHYRREKDGRGLGFRTQQVLLTAVRGFFRWLARQNAIPANPASELELAWRPRGSCSRRRVFSELPSLRDASNSHSQDSLHHPSVRARLPALQTRPSKSENQSYSSMGHSSTVSTTLKLTRSSVSHD